DARVVERLVDGAPELVLAPGKRGEAALALLPVAGWRVEERLRETVRIEPRAQLARFVRVRKQELDAAEAVAGGRGEAVEERMLVVHHGEIRCEVRHCATLSAALSPAPGQGRGRHLPARAEGAAQLVDLRLVERLDATSREHPQLRRLLELLQHRHRRRGR